MKDEKLNNDLDNFFRKELENLPEEKPSAEDWEQMSRRIHSDGLLLGNGNGSNGKKYFLLILLFVLLSGLVSLPFILKDKNESWKKGESKPSETTGNVISGAESKTAETTNLNSKVPSESTAQRLHENSTPEPFRSGNTINSRAKQKFSFAEEKDATPEWKETFASVAGGVMVSPPSEHNGAVENDTHAGVQGTAPASIQDEKNNAAVNATADTTVTTPDSLPVVAQNDTAGQKDTTKVNMNENAKLKRFRLGIYASLDYNYYTLKENSNVPQAESDFVSQSGLIDGDQWGGQYTIGIMGGYLFTQKLSLEAGVFYSQKKKLHADIYTPAYAGAEEPVFTDFKYDYQARYFEIYGRAKYYFLQKKNSFYATLGAASSFNLTAGSDSSDYFLRSSHSKSLTETDHVALDPSSASLVLVLSAGVEIPLGATWEVYVEPAYRYSLNPVIKHPGYDRVPVEHFLRSISLATGLMYKF